jgi:predicted transcriptional regulator
MASTKNILLRLDPALAEQLQAVAEVEQRPVSEVAREAIRLLVEQRRTDERFQRQLADTARAQQRVLQELSARAAGSGEPGADGA